MKLKTYRAWTMAEALTFVKADLGSDAVILHTRTFDRGGFLGFGKRTVVEITAGRAADLPREEDATSAGASAPSRADARRAAVPAGEVVRQSVASRAYGESRASGRAVAEAPVDQAAEREKTRRLALAMSIQLERQADVRDAAAQNERATEAAAQIAATPGKVHARQPASAADTKPRPADAASVAVGAAPLSTQPTHPMPPSTAAAQRFVLVAQPIEAGSGQQGGLERLASAVVAAPVASQTASPASPPVRAAAAETAEATPMWPIERSVTVEAFGFDGDASRPDARAKAPAEAAASGAALDELAEISAFVGRVLREEHTALAAEAPRGAGRPRVESPAPSARTAPQSDARPAPHSAIGDLLEPHYARLIEQEVAEVLARRILDGVSAELADAVDAGATPSERVVREAIERRIAALLPSDDCDGLIGRLMLGGRLAASALENGEAHRIAFVGPTGVGKTTTLAKIAAQLKLKRGLRVGIVAADTYRIAAVEQLRTYAAILELPVEVASSPAEAAAACDRLAAQGVEVILIDTAGRSQNDRMKLSELRAFLAAAAPDETHLVLSATAGERTLVREAEAFGKVGVDRIVLTKLDEAASFGTLINLVERLGKRVSLLTNGQEVPDHIECGRGRRLAELVMGSEVR